MHDCWAGAWACRQSVAVSQSQGGAQCIEGTGFPNSLLRPIILMLGSRALPAFAQGPQSTPSILAPASTPAHEIYQLSLFVLLITGAIFLVVAGLLAFVVIKFRARDTDAQQEPAQIYGSTQVELAWTVIPVLTVIVLFLTTARIIFAIQDAPKPQSALDVTVIGHQFWWEFRYPKLGIVTANALSQRSDLGWYSLEVIVEEKAVRELIPALKKAGASGIIEYPLNKLIN